MILIHRKVEMQNPFVSFPNSHFLCKKSYFMKKASEIILLVLGAMLGGFFLYKGITKHFIAPCKTYGPESTIPVDYQNVIIAFCKSGFFKVVGFLQALSGLLLIIPKTRLLGAVILLPVVINMFLIHFFLDNRPEELWETGIPLAMTLIILVMNFSRVKKIFG
jgi:putative oxidoreductase